MLDITALDKSIKIKAFGRLATSNHPFLMKLRSKLELEDFFHPNCSLKCDRILNAGIELVRDHRLTIIGSSTLTSNRKLISLVKSIRLANIVSHLGKSSLPYFQLVINGKTSINDLNRAELISIGRHIKNRDIRDAANRIADLTGDNIDVNDRLLFPYLDGFKDLRLMTTKQIRENVRPEPECLFKVGVIMTPRDSLNYFDKVNKLTCIQNKLILLKVLHGDVYTNVRRQKFGLTNSALCDKCGQHDNLEHRLLECGPYLSLVDHTLELTKKLGKVPGLRTGETRLDQLLVTHRDVDVTTLTIHSLIIRHIVYQRDLIPPTILINSIITKLLRNEMDESVRDDLRSLLRMD